MVQFGSLSCTSYMDSLFNLYEMLSVGGYVIVDDYAVIGRIVYAAVYPIPLTHDLS